MKLAFLSGHLSNGGAERVISSFSLLAPEGLKPHLLLYEDHLQYPFEGTVHCIGINRRTNFFGKIGNLVRRIWRIRAIKRCEAYTHVISFLENPNLVNLLSRSGEKTIVSVRNNLSRNYQYRGISGKLYESYIARFYRRADLIISLSEGVRQDLIERHGLNPSLIKTLYNPYDINSIQANAVGTLPSSIASLYQFPVLCAVGRLNRQKGFDGLLRSFKAALGKMPDSKLLILGQGDLKASLTNLCQLLNLAVFEEGTLTEEAASTHDVFLVDRLENPFVAMRQARAFCFPSLWEGYGNALAEAVISGANVLAADCPYGPREIVAPGTPYGGGDLPLRTDRGCLLPCLSEPDFSRQKLNSAETQWRDALIVALENINAPGPIPAKLTLTQFDADYIMPLWWKAISNDA